MKPPTIEAGSVFTHPYPFFRDEYSYQDEDGTAKELSWRPGVRMQPRHDDYDAVADGLGSQVLRVISTHKPGKYPTRVFYTRKWVDPDGKTFGKDCCRVMCIGPFRQILRGYRHYFTRSGSGFVVGKLDDAKRAAAAALEVGRGNL